MRIRADVGVIDIIGHLLLWLLLCLVTFGIALFFFPYSFAKFILNRCSVVDVEGNEHQLDCDFDLFSNLGHIVIWFVISVITFGIGYIFYFYKVWNYALNKTKVINSYG